MAQHEITPEMIAAGIDTLQVFYPHFHEGIDEPELIVRTIYEVMQNAADRPTAPTVVEAFEVLAEQARPPEGRDTPSYRRLCRAIIDEHIDADEVARTGKPVMWT
jgi:hypothetical protein